MQHQRDSENKLVWSLDKALYKMLLPFIGWSMEAWPKDLINKIKLELPKNYALKLSLQPTVLYFVPIKIFHEAQSDTSPDKQASLHSAISLITNRNSRASSSLLSD